MEIESLILVDEEARRKGKVTYDTFQKAKQRGVDPDSLREEEQRDFERSAARWREYEAYVLADNVSIAHLEKA